MNVRELESVRAIVQTVALQGRHGPYAMATSDKLEGSVTFSLEPTVWLERELPEQGTVVYLWDLRKKRAGWRAKKGRFARPSDEQTQQRVRSKTVASQTTTASAFKPFIVEGGQGGKHMFRVVSMEDGITRQQTEQLLEKLPVGFLLQKKAGCNQERINEPLEVYVGKGITRIYPPRHRTLVTVNVDSWTSGDVVRMMHIDNLFDRVYPGGQIRACIHFNPKVLGIEQWPDDPNSEIEIDIFAEPKSREGEIHPTPPDFDKWKVRNLIRMIAGGDYDKLTVEQYKEWDELIHYAVQRMRAIYESPDRALDDPLRKYYNHSWRQIDDARGSSNKMVRALISLASAISSE